MASTFHTRATASAAGLPFTRTDIEQTVPERFECVVRHFPERIALSGNGRQWTYRELDEHANRIAHAILARTRPGVGCVAFLTAISPEMVICTLAVLKAGKAYLAIHPAAPASAQREIMQGAAPELLLATNTLAARARELADGRCAVLVLDQIDERASAAAPGVRAAPGDPSTVFYTSGTTGLPKGVVKSHRSVLHRVWLSNEDGIGPNDRQTLLTHASFSASESDMFGALLRGAGVFVFDLRTQGIPRFRDWLGQERITLLHPPPLVFRRFLSTLDGVDLYPDVRLVALAGDTVLPPDVEAWRRHFCRSCVLVHRFSTTESAVLSVARFERDGVGTTSVVSAGRPVADKTLTLVDAAGVPVGAGETGELVVRSRYIADGYWRDAEATADAFRIDPAFPGERIYRTGDRARFLPDGSLAFVGRRHHLAKIRGYRVDAREVEAVLLQMPEVADAATVVQREDDEDRLVSYVVMKPHCAFDPRELRDRLRVYLSEWKLPSRLQPLDEIPTTLTGKVDRQLLERTRPAPTGGRAVCASARPGNAAFSADEVVVRDIWAHTLRVDAVGLDDDFLDLGGDSISALLCLSAIERRCGAQLTVADLFRGPTVRQLAARIASCTIAPAGPRPAAAGVADGFVELLEAHGVEYIFVNPGTDVAPILESIAKFRDQGRPAPELILCLHESVAMAAAHGHFMVSGRPQVVLVHVDVGTLNLGANLHNAQRGRAGVVICAGRAPYTVDAEVPGARDRYNHWIQEQFSQSGIVQGYVKWHYELTRPENLAVAVDRAFEMAAAAPAGPVYLMLPREVLMQPQAAPSAPARRALPPAPAADPAMLAQAADWLVDAQHPLLLVAYAGRNPRAVAALVQLAEALAVPVVESRHRMNFPSRHPLHLGFAPVRYLQQADCVLVVDHDVPWIPAQGGPAAGARVVQIDIDPLKQRMPIWGFPVDLSIHADSALACAALAAEVLRRLGPAARERIEERRRVVTAEHEAQQVRLRQRARDLASRTPIAPDWAACCLGEILDDDTIVVSEAVTSSAVLWSHLQGDAPGSWYQSLGSGLGWGLGAALGAKLAAPSKTVICVTGDGSWLFGEPIAAYWAAGERRSAFLTVVFNNQEYLATTEAILAVAPEGHARTSGRYPACDLPKPPLISRVAEALGLWARTVADPAELRAVLREALLQVRGGRCALVDICIASARPGHPAQP